MKKYEVKDHAPSLLPDGYDFELVWSDEFDGDSVDPSKWDYRLCMMGKRHPAWTDKGVKVENVNGAIEINVNITVAKGANVKTVAEETQETIKDRIQTMTGNAVTKVNVTVADIIIETEE